MDDLIVMCVYPGLEYLAVIMLSLIVHELGHWFAWRLIGRNCPIELALPWGLRCGKDEDTLLVSLMENIYVAGVGVIFGLIVIFAWNAAFDPEYVDYLSIYSFYGFLCCADFVGIMTCYELKKKYNVSWKTRLLDVILLRYVKLLEMKEKL